MNWTKYVLISAVLCLNNLVTPVVLGQKSQQAVPVKGIATVEGDIQDAQTKNAGNRC